MIYFNDIELDYTGDILNKLVIKRALSSIDSISDRKGTSSTNFDLPRTAHNEKTLGFITNAGVDVLPYGSCYIKLDNNIYTRGMLYVTGYTDDVIKCNYFGQDLDFIKNIKEIPLKRLINEDSDTIYSGAYTIFNDLFFKNNLGAINTAADIDFLIGHPMPFYGVMAAPLLAPFFKVKSMLTRLFELQGLTMVSNFFDTQYAENLYWSCFDGTHKSSTMLLSETNTQGSGVNQIDISMGDIAFGTDVTYNSTTKVYTLTKNVENLKIRAKVSADKSASIRFIIIDDTGTYSIHRSEFSRIGTETIIDIDVTKTLLTGYQFYFYGRKNISDTTTVTVKNCVIQTDVIAESDYLMLADYLGTKTQYDFLSDIMKHHNLVMDVDNDVVYIETQIPCTMPVGVIGGTLETTTGIGYELQDITENISVKKNVILENDLYKGIKLSQTIIANERTNDIGIKFGDLGYGEAYYEFNPNYKEIQSFNSNINNTVESVDFFDSTIPPFEDTSISKPLNWDNYLIVRLSIFGTFGDTVNTSYVNLNATTSMVDAYDLTALPCRITYLAGYLFISTLLQNKNNQVTEVELYDKTGTLISFRKNYIIDNQKYKLIEYDFEPVSRKVKAKLKKI